MMRRSFYPDSTAALAEIISVTVYPQPSSRQMTRNAWSDTPAMGARAILLLIVTVPMFMGSLHFQVIRVAQADDFSHRFSYFIMFRRQEQCRLPFPDHIFCPSTVYLSHEKPQVWKGRSS